MDINERAKTKKKAKTPESTIYDLIGEIKNSYEEISDKKGQFYTVVSYYSKNVCESANLNNITSEAQIKGHLPRFNMALYDLESILRLYKNKSENTNEERACCDNILYRVEKILKYTNGKK